MLWYISWTVPLRYLCTYLQSVLRKQRMTLLFIAYLSTSIYIEKQFGFSVSSIEKYYIIRQNVRCNINYTLYGVLPCFPVGPLTLRDIFPVIIRL